MTTLKAKVEFHRAIAEAHAQYADALEAGPSGVVDATAASAGMPKMSQTTAWYAKHGSVLRKIAEAGGEVTISEFNSIADAAGYTAGSRGQLYRKGGLLMKDVSSNSVTLTEKGQKRLEFATQYLMDHGFTL